MSDFSERTKKKTINQLTVGVQFYKRCCNKLMKIPDFRLLNCYPLSPTFCLFLSFSVSVCLCLSLSISVSVCLSVCLSLSLSLCLSLSSPPPPPPEALLNAAGNHLLWIGTANNVSSSRKREVNYLNEKKKSINIFKSINCDNKTVADEKNKCDTIQRSKLQKT